MTEPDLDRLVVDALQALGNGDVERARALLEEAESRSPGDRDVLLLRATLLAAEDDTDGALDVLEQGLADHPGDPVVGAARAALLLDAYDDAAAALPLLEASAEALVDQGAQDPDFLHDVLLRLSECRLLLCDAEGALDAAADASDLAPGSADALVARATALVELGQVADAAALVDAVLEAAPDHARAHAVRGAVLDLQGDRAGANEAYAKAAALEDDEEGAPTALAQDAFEARVRASVAALPDELKDVLERATQVFLDLPAPGELAHLPDPRLHGSLVVATVEEDDDGATPRVAYYRRSFEVAGMTLDDVEDVAATIAIEEIEQALGAPDDEPPFEQGDE